MSRCYPFPPPGYIRNAPAELELPSKKEKRKHKDKKTKRKKHSATNADLILQEKDISLEEIQQSGQANEGFKAGSERSSEMLFTTSNHDAIQRLQNDKLRDEVFSNCVLATNVERPKQRPQSHKLKHEGLSNGVLAANAERLQADRSRENGGLANDNKRSKQSMHANSKAEVLANGMPATHNRRLKADNLRGNLSNGSTSANCERPEQGLLADNLANERPEQGLLADNLANEVFSNGVLSTKRKRLQADNQGDKLLPSGVLANDCKRSQQGAQAVSSKYEALPDDVRATSNMRPQADRCSDKFLSKAIISKRSEQRCRADNTSIKAMRDDVQATSSQAGSRNGKELSQHSRATHSRLQADKPKHEVMSNGMLAMECEKLQADNIRVKMPSNGVLGTRGGRSEQNLQVGTKVVSNGVWDTNVRDTNVRSSLATNPSEKVFSGAVLATNYEKSEKISQVDRLTKEVLPNGVPTASTKILQAGTATPEVISPGVRATSSEGVGQRLQAGNSRHETWTNGVLDAGRLQTDKSRTKLLSHRDEVTSIGRPDLGLHEDQLKKEVVSNGVLASDCEEFNAEVKVKSHLPQLTARATNSDDAAVAKDATPASRASSACDDELIRLCRPLARPLTGQVCAEANDEDWLISCNKQLQSKPRERWDRQIPQVWAEAVLLPSVGINALPYVVPN